MNSISFLIEHNNITTVKCQGRWIIETIEIVEKKFFNIECSNKAILFNLNSIEQLDSSGATLILLKVKDLEKLGCKVDIVTNNLHHKRLLKIIKNSITQKDTKPQKRSFLYIIGKNTTNFYNNILQFIAFIGEFFIKSLYLINLKNFRVKEISYFIYSTGIKAVPIIALTAFLVGVVIAYQTIVQLSKFGADIFVVDASAISITRELGPMITAIVVAGRSASAFSAEIGAMKLTQEIDAMKTMGFKPFYFLIIPRVVALLIVMPILIFLSDIMGIFGAMVATKAQIGLSFNIFIDRLYEVLELKHYIIGIVKGPFFAIIIALIGSFHGLRVTQNTESIGVETTNSVVNAIFLVIICDALFSVIFTRLGL